MRSTIGLLALLFLFIGRTAAQVPNSGFEQLNADNSVSNWGNTYLFATIIDSDGTSHSDSIVFNHFFYFSTTDAHTGSRALEIDNAYNYTEGNCIIGAAGVSTDSIFMAFGSISYVPVTVAPTNFSFYYKYLPLNNDSAMCRLIVYDSFYGELGRAEMYMSGTVSSYTYANAPVVMSAAGTPAFMSVNFYCATNLHPATFGTRLLIDDVGMGTTAINDPKDATINLTCYPTVATGTINILVGGLLHTQDAELAIYDISGRCMLQKKVNIAPDTPVSLAVDNYPAGSYLVALATDAGRYRARFVK